MEIKPKEQSSLQDALDQLDQIYRTSPVGMCLVDSDLRYVRINKVLAEINNASVEEHVGRTIAEVIPKLAPFIEPAFRQVLETGDPILEIEIQSTTPQAESAPKDWVVNYFPYFAADGSVRGVSVTVQEITAIKRAQRESEEAFLKGLLEGQERERSRLSRELHDSAAQNISGLAFHIAALAEGSIEEFRERAEELSELASSTGDSIRHMALDLHPLELDLLGFSEALQQYLDLIQRQVSLSINLQLKGESKNELLSDEVALTAYRVCQEAITNAIKHAQATRIDVEISWESELLTISITDDGVGIDSDDDDVSPPPLGIISMKERAQLVSGSLLIGSADSGGTAVRLELPFTENK